MPIIIRLREPAAMPSDLVRLMQQSPDDYQLECWSDADFCCPYCLHSVAVFPRPLAERQTCPKCAGGFWARWLPWAAAITSTDDPALRKDHST